MSVQKEQTSRTVASRNASDEPRMLPFAVAGLVCFTIAVILGTGSWLVFGTRRHRFSQPLATAQQTPEFAPSPVAAPADSPVTATESSPAPVEPSLPASVVEIEGGEIALGGGDSKLPVQRAIVGDFAIASTEVTNAEYAEFVSAAKHAAPADWKNGEVPEGRENFPVAGVSFSDALEYCKWLSTKLGLPVRLPTEAEWERAARGTDGRKYPWGDEWQKDAARSDETGSKLSPVKSFPINRSPFGVYDMAGNVWEWTAEKAGRAADIADPRARKALADGVRLRVVKGGSAFEKPLNISAQSRYEIPEDTKDAWVGFRYVIEQKKNP